MTVATAEFTEAPVERVPGFRERFIGMIVRPRATLAGLTDADAWFWPSILLLIGYSLNILPLGIGMGKWGAGFISQAMSTSSPSPSSAQAAAMMRSIMAPIQIYAAMLQVPAYVAATWAVRTLIFYGFAHLLGGAKPAFRRVVAMVGWAWVPLFFQYVGIGVAMLLYPRLFTLLVPIQDPREPINMAAMHHAQWVAQAIRELSPFVFWNLAICVIGVADLFRLPRWKAAIVVLLPTVVQIVLQLAMSLLASSMAGAMGTGMPGSGPKVPGTP
jgi:hypothetical protein